VRYTSFYRYNNTNNCYFNMSPTQSEKTSVVHGIQAPLASSSRGVTFRVVLLCLTFAIFFGYVIPVVDYKFFNTFLGATHLPPGAIAAILTMVLVVNPLLRLISQRAALSRNEILTVYLSCLFSTIVPGIGGNNYFVSFIIGTFYYSTRENKWFDYLKGLPPWFTPALNSDGTYNKDVVEYWYNGLSAGQSIPWGAWLVPLLAWGLFFAAAFTMMACLSVMLRAQWGDNEALAFPLLKLPLVLTEGEEKGALSPFFKNPLMWTGLGVAVFIQGLNGLSLYFPEVPFISMDIPTGPMLSEAPWNQIGWTPLRIYPVVIGIVFLLTSEVSFSFWFFYWFLKGQLIVSYMVGFPPGTLPKMIGTGMPIFQGYQEVGANLAYASLIFWAGRRHLAHIARRAMGRERARDTEKHEALSYPSAFWGFWGSFGLMVAWGIAAGMSWHLSLLLWIGYLVIAVVLSRVIAEGGLLFVHHTWAPLGSLMGLIGGGAGTLISPANGVYPAAFMEFATMQDYRGSLMPSFVQSFKLAKDRGIAARPLLGLLALVIVIGMVMAFTMNVRLGYENNGLALQGWLSQNGPKSLGGNLANYATLSEKGSLVAWGWLGGGALVILGLVFARSRFGWFPLHPIGYIMGFTLPMQYFWFSIMVGWSCKTLIAKYGGQDSVRRATPMFLGLALGDVAMMLLWIIIDGWQGRTGHQLMPG
jgi:hypothetical protein